jgi:hypothetical protein
MTRRITIARMVAWPTLAGENCGPCTDTPRPGLPHQRLARLHNVTALLRAMKTGRYLVAPHDTVPWFVSGDVTEVSRDIHQQYRTRRRLLWVSGTHFACRYDHARLIVFWRWRGVFLARVLTAAETRRFCDVNYS